MNVVSPGVTAAEIKEASIASGKYDRFIKWGFESALVVPKMSRKQFGFFLEPDRCLTATGSLRRWWNYSLSPHEKGAARAILERKLVPDQADHGRRRNNTTDSTPELKANSCSFRHGLVQSPMGPND